jgi:hypothetical protein
MIDKIVFSKSILFFSYHLYSNYTLKESNTKLTILDKIRKFAKSTEIKCDDLKKTLQEI